MPLNLTQITSGAWADSTTVKVSCTDVDGTAILLHRGNLLIGNGTLAAGECTINVSPLASGDVIYASVSEKGNRCGAPAIVANAEVHVTGWKTPTELSIITKEGDVLNMPSDLFLETYGYLPAPIYDPEGTGAIIFPEYEPMPVGGIGFDILVNQQFEQTQIYIQNVRGTRGATFVRFNGGAWSGTASKILTSAASVVIDVRGEDDTEYATRTVPVTVSSNSAESPFDLAYRIDYESHGIFVFCHTTLAVDFRLEGYDNTWQAGWVNNINEWQKIYVPVPAGSYIAWVRPTGNTNPNTWVKVEFSKYL